MDVWADFLSRWLESFRERPAFFGLAVIALGLVLTRLLRDAKEATWRRAAMGLSFLAASAGVWLALRQAWIADDAFISFRYARHFAEGHGLVWNLGERVEGYTNFLWTVVLGAGIRLGVGAPYLSTALTLTTLVGLAVWSSRSLARDGWIPLAPGLLVLSPPLVEFATGGLEALPAAAAIAGAALCLRDEKTRAWAAWWVAIAALLRPDHALFFGVLALVQLRAGRKAWLHLVAAGAVWGAWWVGRWVWYGAAFPNTFYAKAGGTYWSQGGWFFLDLVLTTQLWLALPVGVLLAWKLRRTSPSSNAFAAFALPGALLFALYVASVGGDFMEYRFGLTSLVLAAFWLDDVGARWVTSGKSRSLAVLALLPLAFAVSLLPGGEKRWNLSRESSFYLVGSWRPLVIRSGSFTTGQKLAQLPEEGATVPPLAVGAIGMVGALTRVPVVDMLGLTNPVVAHKQVKGHGRPGHEKVGTTAELITSGAHWSLEPGWGALAETTRFSVVGLDVWVLRDTPALRRVGSVPEPAQVLSRIHSPEALNDVAEALPLLYQDRPEVLRDVTKSWGRVLVRREERPQAVEVSGACDDGDELWGLADGCAKEVAHCQAGAFRLETSCRTPQVWWRMTPTAPPLVLTARPGWLHARGDTALLKFGFDDPHELEASAVTELAGTAFAWAEGAVVGQNQVVGRQGKGLLNGFVHGDAATGRLRMQFPVTAGQRYLISARVGGGADCARLGLRVAGQRWCGQDDEVLRTRAVMVEPTTDTLELELVDEATGGWGHLLVDELELWPLP